MITPGTPEKVNPVTSNGQSPLTRVQCSPVWYQIDGSVGARCGSFASMGLPLVVRTPETTQEFEPRPDPAGPSMVGRPSSTSCRWRSCRSASFGNFGGGWSASGVGCRPAAGRGSIGSGAGSAAGRGSFGSGAGSAAGRCWFGDRLGAGRGWAGAGERLGAGRPWVGGGGRATGGSRRPVPGPWTNVPSTTRPPDTIGRCRLYGYSG